MIETYYCYFIVFCLLAFLSLFSCCLFLCFVDFFNSDIIWFISCFLLYVFFRNFLCGYHGAYIIHLMVTISYFNTLTKTLLIYSPYYHFSKIACWMTFVQSLTSPLLSGRYLSLGGLPEFFLLVSLFFSMLPLLHWPPCLAHLFSTQQPERSI